MSATSADSVPSLSDYTPLGVVSPDPGAMLASLRAIGYSLPAAVADIVDNSITAGAHHIRLTFYWDGAGSRVTFADDGHGMDRGGLIEAMRLGGRGPEEERSDDDLGRFGLGLKTASFSQCRRLTVVTRTGATGAALEAATWDLDHVATTGEWALLTPTAAAMPTEAADLAERSGTVVTWELLDRVVGDSTVEDADAGKRFRQQVRAVEDHLSAVFHRFLVGRGRVKITINDRELAPWDPFMEDHAATMNLGAETLVFNDEAIEITPFVLPHRSKLTDKEHDAAGRGDWNGRQGFYVYRNRRLLMSGGWMRLFASEEHTKLARVRVDLPNTLDHEWQIDVKKAVARPPGPLRDQLRRIATVARRDASNVYRHRGKVVARGAGGSVAFLWERRSVRGTIAYRLNREHPLVRDLIEMQSDGAELLRAVLRLAEETVPVPLIVLDSAEHPDEHAAPFDEAAGDEVLELMERLFASLVERGAEPELALEQLAGSDPFSAFPELIAVVKEKNGI